MKIPPLVIGAALLLWGVESGRLLLGVILCVVLEFGNYSAKRYHLDEEDFVKISDLTSLLFLGGVALILLNYDAIGFLRITTGWLPLILAPLAAAQLYSTSDTIVIGTRLGKHKKAYTHKPVDFRPYYIMVCLFAAAAANSRSIWFFPAVGGILAVLLYYNRGKSYSTSLFALLFTISLSIGYGATLVLERGHDYAVHNTYRFLYKYYRGKHSNPFKSHVNFGETGRMNYSGEIVMRVDADSPPPLLREAAYTTFQRGDWFGNQSGYEFLLPVTQESWNLVPSPHPDGAKATVEQSLPQEKGLLPTPAGAFSMKSATVFELEQNTNGTLRAVDAARVATYEVSYAENTTYPDDIPSFRHLFIPEEEIYVLEEIRRHLAVDDRPLRLKLAALKEFFAGEFSYSLSLVGSGDYETPLGNFLLSRKSGFCEYYATAATLLLRALDIPSRYVIGYAVSERSALEDKYIVRSRHAHAWSEAYVDGRWVTVDTTPSVWLEADAQQASTLEPLRDVFDFLRHKYRLFRIGTGTDYTLALSVVVVLLTAFLVFRIYRRMRLERAAHIDETSGERSFERIYTPFTPVVDTINASDVPRENSEPFVSWAARCWSWQEFDKEEFDMLYRLHLQMRFDPQGAGKEIWMVLEHGAEKYIRELEPEHH